MASKRHPRPRKSRRQERRERAAALRAQGLPFTEIGRRLGITKQAAWHLIMRPRPAGRGFGVRCSACRAVVTARHLQARTVGGVLCPRCLAARPDAGRAKPQRATRARLAEVLGAPDLGRFGDENG
jgi:hypothetical protein